MVKSEYNVAASVDNDLDPTLTEYLENSGLEVKEPKGGANVELYKKLPSGEELRVFFDIDEVTDVEAGAPTPEDEEFDQDMLDLVGSFASVKVLISNPEKNNGLFFNLLLQNLEEEFFVDYFNFKNDVSGFLGEVAKTGSFEGNFEYQGPRFSNLDESLQTSVEKYLDDKGVDKDLSNFIYGFSDVREEERYRELLSDVATYLKQ